MGVVLFNTSLKWPQAHFINQGWICAEQGSVNETYLDCAKFHSLATTTVMKVAKKMNWKIFTLKAIWLALTNILQSFNSLFFSVFLSNLNWIQKNENPKWRLEFSIYYGIRGPYTQMRVQGDLVFMRSLTSRQVLHLYMTLYSIHSTARHVNLCLSPAHPGRS